MIENKQWVVLAVVAFLVAQICAAAIDYRIGAKRQCSKCQSEMEALRLEVLELKSEAVRRGFADWKSVVSETEQQFRWKEQK